MPEKRRTMTYFAFALPNQTGELARFSDRLKSRGINLIGMWGYAEGEDHPQISCVPEDAEAFRSLALDDGLACEEGKTLFFEGVDEPGALRSILKRVADAGVNVDAIECVGVGGRFGCFLWCAPEHFESMEKALK